MTEPTPLSRNGQAIQQLCDRARERGELGGMVLEAWLLEAYNLGLADASPVSENGPSADTKRMDFVCTTDGQLLISRLTNNLPPDAIRNIIDAEILRRANG